MRTEPTAQTEWCASSPLPRRTGAAAGRLALAGALAAMLLGITAAQAQSAPDIYKATLGQQNQATAEISTEELRRILDEKSATVFDARPFMEYGAGHIAGAVNVAAKPGVPMSAYVSDVHEIDRLLSGRKDAPIVLYCNGPFCGKSKRLAEELLQAGFTDVRRYQLGAPVWRALGGVMQIEPASFQHVLREDRTAVIFDARTAGEFAAGTLEGARHLPKEEVVKAKDDGRLPMEDHNTRIVVFADSAATARAAAEEIAKNAFHNVAFCADLFCGTQVALK